MEMWCAICNELMTDVPWDCSLGAVDFYDTRIDEVVQCHYSCGADHEDMRTPRDEDY